MYTHNAVNLYYYKYTVDGMNIIFVSILCHVIKPQGDTSNDLSSYIFRTTAIGRLLGVFNLEIIIWYF